MFFGIAQAAQSHEVEGNKVFLLYRLSLICEGFIEIVEYQFRNSDVTFAWLTFNVDEPHLMTNDGFIAISNCNVSEVDSV